jgi:hypothetical protein
VDCEDEDIFESRQLDEALLPVSGFVTPIASAAPSTPTVSAQRLAEHVKDTQTVFEVESDNGSDHTSVTDGVGDASGLASSKDTL